MAWIAGDVPGGGHHRVARGPLPVGYPRGGAARRQAAQPAVARDPPYRLAALHAQDVQLPATPSAVVEDDPFAVGGPGGVALLAADARDPAQPPAARAHHVQVPPPALAPREQQRAPRGGEGRGAVMKPVAGEPPHRAAAGVEDVELVLASPPAHERHPVPDRPGRRMVVRGTAGEPPEP